MRLASLVAAAGLFGVAACGPDSTKGACKEQLLPGDLVITEVFADYAAPTGGTGTDDGKEWFEIYNNADRAISLKGVSIVHSKPDGTKPASHTISEVTVAPGQYFTLGNATSDLVPAYVDYGFSSDLGTFYNTGGGKLALKCGDEELDSAVYDTVKSGHSRQLSNQGPPDYTLNDDQVNWCEAKDTEFESGNFGTPGQENDCAPVVEGACNDGNGMRAVVSPTPGDLVITEVMPGPAKVSDTVGEWFEVKALHDLDVNGLTLDRAGDTTTSMPISSPTCLHMAAGSYAVFAKSTDMAANGGITPPVLGTFTFSMIAGSTSAPGDVQILSGSTVIDAVTWTSSRTGKSLQLDPDLTDATSNDQPSNFCDATTPYGMGDLGTPAAANGQCTMLPPAGMCDDAGTLRNIVKPAANALVITELMANPKAIAPLTEANEEWFEITNVGSAAFDLNGLGLDRAADSTAPNTVNSAACKSLAPNAFALFAHSSDPMLNAMLPPPDATFSFSMVNSGGDVQVVDPTTCTGTPIVCTTIYDAVAYATTSDGISAQVKPGMYTTTANDTATNFCPGVAPYGDGTNKGTPKADNACM